MKLKRYLKESIPFKSNELEKAVQLMNNNGARIVNDGKSYIIGAFTYMGDVVSVVTTASKQEANNLVKQFKNNSQVAIIRVQKGNDIISYTMHGSKKWFEKIG